MVSKSYLDQKLEPKNRNLTIFFALVRDNPGQN